MINLDLDQSNVAYNQDSLQDYNQDSLQELKWLLEKQEAKFLLILAHCNSINLQKYLGAKLQEICSIQIREMLLDKSVDILDISIQEKLDQEQTQALMVYGLESVNNINSLLRSASGRREDFGQKFSFPLILWVTNDVLSKIIRLAPDFYNWTQTFEFKIPSSQLITFIQQTTDEILDKVIKAGAGKLLQRINITLNLESDSPHLVALESAWNELQIQRVPLESDSEASLEFVLGLATYDSCDKSWKHYRRSLKLWQQNNNLLQVQYGCLLFYQGRWYRTFADRHLTSYNKACERAKDYFQQSISIFEQCNRLDLVANFINALGDVLQRLEQWNDLEKTAKKAINLYPTHSKDKFRLARAYGFLAQVARSKQDWTNVKEYAEKALEIFKNAVAELTASKEMDNIDRDCLEWEYSYHQGWYLLSLAQAQSHQQQKKEAIKHLELARKETKLEYDAKLYIKILKELHTLYFEQRQYQKAFNLKQERLSILQQYNFRGFIGAVRLQPEKTLTNPALQSLSPSDELEKIPQEIIASGRQPDVDRLVERMSRPDFKLTVIYGPSGVGKSSILQAGLIPELKRCSVNNRQFLPVLLETFYGDNDWNIQLNLYLENSRKPKEIIISLDKVIGSAEYLIEKLIKSSEKNAKLGRTIVIIFDGFEELFLTSKNLQKRSVFYNFFQQCLNIDYVKVILSIREDYLHYLLEINRKVDLEVINNDILSKNTLYYLGNFSLEQAKLVIKSLTKLVPFSPEDQLIDQLVKNLAGEKNEVSPIELQMVGAQLETDEITTLKKYHESGSKEGLVERYLEEVINDCGSENKRAAQLILYLLTDENNIKQIRTEAELKVDLGLDSEQLKLVLNIFLHSGLVCEVLHSASKHYQLAHDYLVNLIRQQFQPEIIEELKLTRQELRKALKKTAIAEIKALNSLSEALWLSHDQLGALVASLKAGKKLKETTKLLDVKVHEIKTHEIANTLGNIFYRIQEFNRFQGHSAKVNSVCFSPNDKKIVSAGADGMVKIWSLDGTELQSFLGHRAEINSVCFSHDSQKIASASADGMVKIWSLDGTELQSFSHSTYVNCVTFSHDDKKIVSASADGMVKIWSLDGTELQSFQAHSRSVNSISFSRNSEKIASASADGTIKIWSFNGKLLHKLNKENSEANSVCFSPDDCKIAIAKADRTVKVWQLDDLQLQPRIFEGHKSHVKSVAFSPDSEKIVSASADGTLKLWSLDGTLLQTFREHSDEVNNVCFHPHDEIIASASADGIVKLWRFSRTELQTFSVQSDLVTSICFSPDNQKFAIASSDGMIKIWSIEGKQLQAFQSHDLAVNSICFSSDSKKIASASADHTVKLWTIEGEELMTFEGHDTWVRGVCFGYKNNTIISGYADGTIKMCDFQGKEILPPMKEDGHEIKIVSCSPNGQSFFASVSTNEMVRIWNMGGKLLKQFQEEEKIESLCFIPDSQIIALGRSDGKVTIWNFENGERQTFEIHRSNVNNICFSCDGKTITSASVDGTVKHWNLKGQELKSLRGPGKWIKSIWLSPNGKMVISVSIDGTLLLWTSNLNFDLDYLLKQGCNWACNYLKTNPNVSESDRLSC